ncbi:hypothetical protein BS47DRAFT_1488813 [Hydnum rufescens UP504]|uniref:Enoyl reductase (ER) domain-containing protein n=1 Tax=Hydnum rufescens UP504 TaxID=1448309 RepID=A0A9P6AKQ0_9AGAM|nr:hypothetical protein BS47DRAFT_1488813 [Hydnum rufescens UP504]
MALTIPSSTKRVHLAKRPKDFIDGQTFALETIPLRTPGPGEVVVRVDYVALDAAMRGWIRDMRSYVPPVKIGETMRAYALGTVLTDAKTVKKGDRVIGMFGWAEFVTVGESSLRKITPPPYTDALDFLNLLGLTGLTAYFGLLRVGNIKPGETLVVSGAAGATGSTVCQFGKLLGAKVIGIAGAADKCKWLVDDLGIDKAYNYKDKGWKDAFKKEVRTLDVFFDNVGGDTLDFFLTRLNQNARVVLCGAISGYNSQSFSGLRNYMALITQRAKIEGFLTMDYADQYSEAEAAIARWIREGKLKRKFHIETGLAECPQHLALLFQGGNTGKLVVRISQEQARL